VTEYTINPERGEVGVTLGGKLYPMRPSHEAQVAVERRLGVSLDELFTRARRFAESLHDRGAPTHGVGLTLREMSVIVAEGAKAAGKERDDKLLQQMNADQCAELIAEKRFACFEPVMQFIVNALFGGANPEKKELAAPGP